MAFQVLPENLKCLFDSPGHSFCKHSERPSSFTDSVSGFQQKPEMPV
jgi:hypothetical protein